MADRGYDRSMDHFRGGERLLKLSLRLMDWYQDPVTDEEVAAAIGAELVPVFRYAQDKLTGKVRKVTLEPAFCHSADVAFRAIGLGYPVHVLKVCFLHDVIEDISKTIADVPKALQDMVEHVGADVEHEVRLLTNRFQLIFRGLALKVRKDIPFDTRGRKAFRAALDVLRNELPEPDAAAFSDEFDRLAGFLDSEVDLGRGARVAKRDRKFTLATFLERETYQLYAEDLATRAARAAREGGDTAPITALVTKLVDQTDNIRTSEVSNRLSLFKLAHKAEAVLDRTQIGFLDAVPNVVAEQTTVPAMYRLVQLRLVDQLEARRRAISDNFSETRFASLVTFLGQQNERLAAKYDVPAGRIIEIRSTEDKVRMLNGAPPASAIFSAVNVIPDELY